MSSHVLLVLAALFALKAGDALVRCPDRLERALLAYAWTSFAAIEVVLWWLGPNAPVPLWLWVPAGVAVWLVCVLAGLAAIGTTLPAVLYHLRRKLCRHRWERRHCPCPNRCQTWEDCTRCHARRWP